MAEGESGTVNLLDNLDFLNQTTTGNESVLLPTQSFNALSETSHDETIKNEMDVVNEQVGEDSTKVIESQDPELMQDNLHLKVRKVRHEKNPSF